MLKAVPINNIKAFKYLFYIETALRELIIELLETTFGSKWYKSKLPGDILKKYKNSLNSEKKIKFSQLIPHHPIYYIDFPDLLKIIIRDDNWNTIFKKIFVRKENISSSLSDLDYIRNKVAHNRKISNEDIKIIEASLTKINKCIGDDFFKNLVIKCTTNKDILERLKSLEKEATEVFNLCIKFNSIKITEWHLVKNIWWFDESYLGCDLSNIIDFFKTIQNYEKLPRYRGSGYLLEKWKKSSEIKKKYKLLQNNFKNLL